MSALIKDFRVGEDVFSAYMDYQKDILEIRDIHGNMIAEVDSWGKAIFHDEKYKMFSGAFRTNARNEVILKNDNDELIHTSKEKYFYLAEIDAFKYIAEKANEIQKETTN